MNIRVTTLVENCVKRRGVKAEHGLSMLIETTDNLLLFDTGASNLFIDNAKALGKKIEDVDYLILSHGHSDHTGGLKAFLDLNTKAKVICKSSIFIPKFRGARENGISGIEADDSRFIFVDRVTELVPNIYIFPGIDIVNKKDTHFFEFEIKTERDREPDLFTDELAIAIVDEKMISILSACSHRGVTNIISSIRNYFPTHKLNYLVGGFHLIDSLQKDTLFIIDYLKNDMPEYIGVCHCTGIDNFITFVNMFGDKVFYNYCGTEIVI